MNLFMRLFVSCPLGMQYLLEQELIELGLSSTRAVNAGVEAEAELEQVYRCLLWSRIANRVFLELATGKIERGTDVYRHASSIPWAQHFSAESTFAVSFSGTNKEINNSAYGALSVKDAIVDHFRSLTGDRPSVDKTSPDIRVSAKLSKGRITISLDLAGQSLHKRGYRLDKGPAPLKENLAAALLRQSGWSALATEGGSFLDPMCGSGTFCIEAVLMATDTAPGLSREEWGFDKWKKHDAAAWLGLVQEAEARSVTGKESFKGKVLGLDMDSRVIGVAWENIQRANISEFVHVEKRSIEEFDLPENTPKGLLLTNPPYGERLGEIDQLMGVYRSLGDVFLNRLQGWRAGVFTGNPDLEKFIGWRYYKRYKFLNGAIESAVLLFELDEDNRFQTAWLPPQEKLRNPAYWRIANEERANMLANRLRKNEKTIAKWAKKNNITCYRLYDADMPEYAFAIDRYEGESGEVFLYVQEYAPPKSVDEKAAIERLSEGLKTIAQTLVVPELNVFLKQRSVKKGKSQYEKEDDSSRDIVVREGDVRVAVKLGRYLDTGLFLDHRAVRRWMSGNAKGKKVLNLFSYTSVASLQAAIGGACSVLSVDMSQTYLKWAQHNFALNGLKGGNYKFERANCMEWLEDASTEPLAQKYDLIFIDPPSFSNSKRMEGVFDVQRDHQYLIDSAMNLLNKGGVLIFSSNLRKFSLSDDVSLKYKVVDKTSFSLDKDFERNQKIHKCWFIESLAEDS